MKSKIVTTVLMLILLWCGMTFLWAPNSTAINVWDKISSKQSDLMYKYNSFYTDPTKYWNPMSTINQNYYPTISDLTYKYRSSYIDPAKYWNPMSSINQSHYPTMSDLAYKYTMPSMDYGKYWNPMSTINQRYYSNISDLTYKYTTPTTNLRYTMPSDLTLRQMDMLPPSWSRIPSLPLQNQSYTYMHTPIISQGHSLPSTYQDFIRVSSFDPSRYSNWYGLMQPSYNLAKGTYDYFRSGWNPEMAPSSASFVDLLVATRSPYTATQLTPISPSVGDLWKGGHQAWNAIQTGKITSAWGWGGLAVSIVDFNRNPSFSGFMDIIRSIPGSWMVLPETYLLQRVIEGYRDYCMSLLGDGYHPPSQTISYSQITETKSTFIQESRMTYIERLPFEYDEGVLGVPQPLQNASYPVDLSTLSPEIQRFFNDSFLRGEATKAQLANHLNSLGTSSLNNQYNSMLGFGSNWSFGSSWLNYFNNSYSSYGPLWFNFNYGYKGKY
jgi:hypothetical protein